MSRLPVTFAIFSGAIAGACFLYAWHVRAELAESEAARQHAEDRLGRLADEVDALKKARALNPSPTPTEVPAPEASDGSNAAVAETMAPAVRSASPRDRPGTSPAFRNLGAFERRIALDARFASLFRRLNLAPADLEKLKDLLVQKQVTGSDVMNTAREQGLNPRENRSDLRKLVSTLEAEAESAIRGLLGENGYQQYQEYQRTLPQRGLANQLEQRLSYSPTPLTASQADQLVSLLAAAPPPGTPRNGRGSPVSITDEVLNRSQSFLYGTQLDALRQLQQEQQTRAQLLQQINNRDATPTPWGAPGGTGP